MTTLFALGNLLFSILLITISLSQLFGYNAQKIFYVKNVGTFRLSILIFILCIGFYPIFAIEITRFVFIFCYVFPTTYLLHKIYLALDLDGSKREAIEKAKGKIEEIRYINYRPKFTIFCCICCLIILVKSMLMDLGGEKCLLELLANK